MRIHLFHAGYNMRLKNFKNFSIKNEDHLEFFK